MTDSNLAHAVDWLTERKFRKEDEAKLWFHDSVHFNPPCTPMGASLNINCMRGSHWAAEWFSLPFSLGFETVVYNGYVYHAVNPITDPEKINARAVEFGPKLQKALDNWNAFYAEGVQEWSDSLNYLAGFQKETLPFNRLYDLLKDAEKAFKRSWELHFIYMYPSFFGYMTFEAICQKYNINERDMRTFLQGFETKMFEIDRAMWRLADLAKELGVHTVFDAAEKAEDIKGLMAEQKLGQVWWDQFERFLKQYGKRSTAALFDMYYKTWNEDPYPVLFTIKTYIQKGGFDFDEHTKKITDEREKLIEDTIARIPEEEREQFRQALRHAQDSYPFNEDHNFYVEHRTHSEIRYVIIECGNRLAEMGILKEPDDVFFLTINELKDLMENIIMDERVGIQYFGPKVTNTVYNRKQVWQDLHEVEAPPFIGTIPEHKIEDPVFIKVFGLTDEVIRGSARNTEQVAGHFEGFPGAPGMVEGYARVIFNYDDFQTVQPDELLVAPFTTPAWTPLFSKIRGVVTDSGGMLAHAAICAREYDIPAVVGTITRGVKVTEHIKTGDYIRIDGTNGKVEVITK